MSDEANNRGAFAIQEYYCRTMDAPIYARMCAAVSEGLSRDTAIGARILDWPGEPTKDALPLRFFGGLHALVRAGADAELARVFAGEISDQRAIAAVINRVCGEHRAALDPWLDGPPQTNEPGRSGALMLGLMAVAARCTPRLELLEIGSSGGLNLLIGRYRIVLGGVATGPADSPVTITPDWRGPSPEPQTLEIVSARGCDVNPLDVTDPAIATRLAAYVWPETPERGVRLERAIAMVRAAPVDLARADAADWLEARLAEPQGEGVTRVLMHSVVWQYLPEAVAERIRQAMAAAGERATAARPLAWVAMEPNRAFAHMLVSISSWPGGIERRIIGHSHAHAAWIVPGPPPPGEPGAPAAAPIVL